jgi:hypothetical protein
VSHSTAEQYELGSDIDGTLITTRSSDFGYDDYGNQLSASTVITDSQYSSPLAGQQYTSTTSTNYSPNSGTHCFNVPTSVVVAKTAPGSSAVTRTTNITPDYTHCVIAQKVTEPGNPTYAVTEAYAFDATGNVSVVNVTGAGMQTRTTSTTWGSLGQSPSQIINAEGETTKPEYHPDFGTPKSLEDAA